MKGASDYIRQAANHIQAAQTEEAMYLRAYAQLAQAEIAMATYLITFGSIDQGEK